MPSNSLDAITCRWTVQDVKPAKTNKKPRFRGVFGFSGMVRNKELVPRRGLEPPHRCQYQHLKLARLPIPPSGHWRGFRRSGRSCQRQNAQSYQLSCFCLPSRCARPAFPALWRPIRARAMARVVNGADGRLGSRCDAIDLRGARRRWPPPRRGSDQSPIFSASMKASCGMSTLPNCRIFFLPAFCLSSSLRLRVASPP